MNRNICGQIRLNLYKRISSESNRIAKARELLLAGDINCTDYKSIKSEDEEKIAVLEAKIEDLSNTTYMRIEAVETILDDAIINLTKLDVRLCVAGTNKKKRNTWFDLSPKNSLLKI